MFNRKPIDEYIDIFGNNDLIPIKWFYSKKYKNIDQIYAECVKKGITWRKLTGWKEDRNKGVLL